jgi:hypothetical protein
MLRHWYFRYFLPLLVIVFLIEDVTNDESPRKFFWKNKFSIPDLEDFLMHEIIGTNNK